VLWGYTSFGSLVVGNELPPCSFAAKTLGIPRATASRHWTFARAWLINAIDRKGEKLLPAMRREDRKRRFLEGSES
jgi:hypothetical protein